MKQKRFMQIAFVALSIMSMVVISGCGSDDSKTKAPLVKTMTIGQGMTNNSDSSSFGGVIKNRNKTNLSFQIAGRLVTKNFQVGDHVSQGQVLATINGNDMADKIRNAQGMVNSARSQYELAATNYQRYQTLYNQQAISKLQLDQMENSYKVAAAQLEQAEANLSTSQNQYGYTQVIAPEDGIITASAVEVGQVVAAGQTIGAIAIGNEPEAVISVPEQVMSGLKIGDTVNVSFWALNNTVLPGVIREISPVPDNISRTYTIKISLPNPPESIKLGMTATVHLSNNGQVADAIDIPLTALLNTGDSDTSRISSFNGKEGATTGNGNKQQSNGTIYVVRDKKLVKVNVVLGTFKENAVSVISGLNKGDIVVTAGTEKLSEGEEVRL